MSRIELKQLHEVSFSSESLIPTVGMLGPERWVLVYADGTVGYYTLGAEKVEYLFSISQGAEFDVTAPISVYTMDDIVVIVNDFKLHGWVYTPKNEKVHLCRKDYHADISKFPVALFKNEAGVPHLIYGTDWNRIDIMDLDTLQILTANKSLTDEYGEQMIKEYREKFKNGNSTEFPSPMTYDYFYGALEMSPDNKHFLSKGWVWGSADACHIYEVEHFIKSDALRAYRGFGADHQDRAICWIDNKTIAVTYHEYYDGDGITHKDAQTEILLLDISTGEPNELKKFTLDVFDGLSAEMYFSLTLNALVIMSKQKGFTVCCLEGNILLREESFTPNSFHRDTNSFISISEARVITVHQLLVP